MYIEHPWIYSIGLILTPFVVGGLGLLAYYFYWKNSRLYIMGQKIPGPPTIPFFGNAHIVIGFTTHGNIVIWKALLDGISLSY